MPPPDTARPVAPSGPRGGAAAPLPAPGGPADGAGGAPASLPRRAVRWWADRPVLLAAALYALLSLVFVGQGLLPGRTLSSSDFIWSMAPWASSRPPDVGPVGTNFEPADAVVVFQPFFEFARASFPDIPLWNPHIMAGRPFVANAQSALFSPFTLPALLLPLAKAYAVMALLKLWVAAFGTFLLGRALGMRTGGALLAGVVFAFGTFFVVWLPWPLTNVFPLLPWLLLLSELLVRRPGPLPAAGLAALVGLQFFGGHPETSFHVMWAVVVFFAFRVVLRARAGDGRALLVRRAGVFALALAGGTALAAAALLPLLELFSLSGDYARRQEAEPTHAEPRFIGALFLFDYWGRPTQTPLVAFVSNRGYYAGGLTLMLAAVALILRPTATRVAVGVAGAFALAIVLGLEPLFGALTSLPGFETAHNGRMVVFLLFALALLAGWGVDELSRRSPGGPHRRGAALAAATALFCVPVVWMLVARTLDLGQLREALDLAWGFGDEAATDPEAPPGPDTIATVRLSALLQWLPLAGAGLVLVALRLGFRPRRGLALGAGAFAALALAVLVVDLFRANMGFNTAIPVENARQPETGAIDYLQGRRPNRFAGLDPAVGGQQPLSADLAMRYGLYDARGYDYPVERRYDTWWRATAAPPGELRPPTAVAQATPRALQGMSLLSVSDVIQDPRDPPSRLPGLELAYSGRDARVYRNTNALPRAFLVDRQEVVGGEDAALARTLDPAFDARRVAVTERAVPGIATGGAPGAAPGTARIVRDDGDRLVAESRARRRSLLVLTDVHYPGWSATVDGRPAEIERVDYLLRGVRVPPGRHEVEFSYAPVSWRIGWIVSGLALVALVVVAGLGLRRRRAEGPPR